MHEDDDIADEPHRRPGRKNVLPASTILFQDVVLRCATKLIERDAALDRQSTIKRDINDCRRVYRPVG